MSVARSAALTASVHNDASDWRLLFEHAPVGFVLAGIDGRILEANPAAACIVGRPRTKLLGTRLPDMTPAGAGVAEDLLADLVAGNRDSYRLEAQFHDGQRSPRWLEVQAWAVLDGDGTPRGVVLRVTDVTEHKAAAADLAHRAQHDSLTGLPNRSSVMEQLRAARARGRRSASRVGVVYCDLDGLKSANDRFGHHVGDLVLVAAARGLRKLVREGDLVGRLAGDEFLVICEGLDGPEELEALVSRLRSLVVRVPGPGSQGLDVGISVGAAFDDRGRTSADALLAAADRAMYEDKRARSRSRGAATPAPHVEIAVPDPPGRSVTDGEDGVLSESRDAV